MSEDIEVLKHKAVHKGELCFEGLYIDKCKRLVVRNENEIELTYTEFENLLLLAQNAGIVFSKEQIYDSVWKEPYFGDYNIVMSHIRNIREKIEDNHSIHVIYNRPQNPSKSADTLEAAMTAQGIV